MVAADAIAHATANELRDALSANISAPIVKIIVDLLDANGALLDPAMAAECDANA